MSLKIVVAEPAEAPKRPNYTTHLRNSVTVPSIVEARMNVEPPSAHTSIGFTRAMEILRAHSQLPSLALNPIMLPLSVGMITSSPIRIIEVGEIS